MHHLVSDLVSPEVASRVGRVWGYGSGAPPALDPAHGGQGRGTWGGEGGEGGEGGGGGEGEEGGEGAGRGAPLTCV